MNILLFVTTMIIVIASLTYARLETYRSSSLKQVEFNRYMNQTERAYINEIALKWYKDSRATTRSSTTPNNPAIANARSRLSFLVFVDKAKQQLYSKEYPKLYLLTKKLIYSLYRNQPFFQEFEKSRSDIVDALLHSLMIADTLPAGQKVKKAEDLANLSLNDPQLNTFFYFILKGLIVPEPPPNNNTPMIPLGGFIFEEEEGEIDDENGDPNPSEAFKSPQGYHSLLDFITLEDAVKIRVYLAPKELLKAIYDNPEVVDFIISLRNEFYKKVTKNTMTTQEASTQFKTLVAPKSDPNFDDTILDFSVSKTNPKNYE